MVCWGSASASSGSCSTVSIRKAVSFCSSRFTFAPQALSTSAERLSRSIASRRCSRVKYSCLIRFASASDARKVACSSLAMDGDATSVVLRFHREPEREVVFPGQLLHQADLRLRHLECINPCHANAVVVHVQHDLNRVRLRLVEDLAEDGHHEVPGGVVVVVEQHLVQLGPLELLFGLGLGGDVAFVLDL